MGQLSLIIFIFLQTHLTVTGTNKTGFVLLDTTHSPLNYASIHRPPDHQLIRSTHTKQDIEQTALVRDILLSSSSLHERNGGASLRVCEPNNPTPISTGATFFVPAAVLRLQRFALLLAARAAVLVPSVPGQVLPDALWPLLGAHVACGRCCAVSILFTSHVFACIMKIGVFGSSSQATSKKFLDAAFKLGELIAKGGHICVNGAGK